MSSRAAAKRATDARQPAGQGKTVKEEQAERLVPFLIPKDPAYPESYQVFEMNINGRGFIYPRGEWLEIPKSHAAFIMERDRFARERAGQYAAFTQPGGANIT